MTSPTFCADNPTRNLIEGSRGKPPETVITLDLPPPVERPRSPIPIDVQRDPKKGKSHESDIANLDVEGRINISEMDTSMLEVEDTSPAVVIGASTVLPIPSGNDGDQASPSVAGKQATGQKPSFRDIMVGTVVNQMAKKEVLPRPTPEGNEDLYGPWMQVVSRKKKGPTSRNDSGFSSGGLGSNGRSQGSRFNALASLGEGNATGSLKSMVQTQDPIVFLPMETTAVTSLQGVLPASGQENTTSSRSLAAVPKNGEGNKAVSNVVISGKETIVASRDTMVSVRSSLNKDNHVAVRVVDSTVRQTLKERNGRVYQHHFLRLPPRG
ncbi:hypothetical protein V6N13_147880 [Hibiscus sabdariffa]